MLEFNKQFMSVLMLCASKGFKYKFDFSSLGSRVSFLKLLLFMFLPYSCL